MRWRPSVLMICFFIFAQCLTLFIFHDRLDLYPSNSSLKVNFIKLSNDFELINATLNPSTSKLIRGVTDLPTVAICIRGTNRYLDNSKKFQKTLVDALHADVFLVIQSGLNGNVSLAKNLKYVSGDFKDYGMGEIVEELENEGFNQTFWRSVPLWVGHNALSPFIPVDATHAASPNYIGSSFSKIKQ